MLPHSICKISGYANVELFPFFDDIDPPGIQICPLKVVKPDYIKSPPEQEGFLYNGSPGRTRTADQMVNSHPLYRLSYRGVSLFPLAYQMVNSKYMSDSTN